MCFTDFGNNQSAVIIHMKAIINIVLFSIILSCISSPSWAMKRTADQTLVPAPANFSVLNADVIAYIFRHVDFENGFNVPLVCKLFNSLWPINVRVVSLTQAKNLPHLNKILNYIKEHGGLINITEISTRAALNKKSSTQQHNYPVNEETFLLASECFNLEKLQLGSGTNIVDPIFAEGCVLKGENWPKLRHFELDYVNRPESWLLSLACCLELEVFRVRGFDITNGGSALIQALGKLAHLKKIGIWTGKGTFSDSNINLLQSKSQIKELILATCNSSEDNLACLTEMKSLEHLGIFYMPFPAHKFSNICELFWLKSLHMGNLDQFPADSFQDIAKLSNLTNLAVTRLNAGTAGLKHISSLPLASLRLSSCTGINDEIASVIAQLPRLNRLDLSDLQQVNEDAIIQMVSNKTLTGVQLIDLPTITRKTVESIAKRWSDNGELYYEPIPSMYIKGCPGVTQDDANALTEKYPGFCPKFIPVQPTAE